MVACIAEPQTGSSSLVSASRCYECPLSLHPLCTFLNCPFFDLPTARTVSPTPSSNATNCNRHHTITVTDKACSDAPKIPATVTSCHCPSMTSTVARFAQSSSSIDRPIASSSAAPVTPVKPQLPGDTDLGNNSVTKSCLQERGRDLQGNFRCNLF